MSQAGANSYSTAFDDPASTVPPGSVAHGRGATHTGSAAVRLASWLGLAAMASPLVAAGMAGAREVVRALMTRPIKSEFD